MALSAKEVARRIIDQLPDDVSHDVIVSALDQTATPVDSELSARATSVYVPDEVVTDADASPPEKRRLVKKGFVTVLEPTRPVPMISAETVNYIIEKVRRDREDRFLGLSEDVD